MSTATISEQRETTAASSPPPTSVLFQNCIEVPLGISSLSNFREWARSDAFPEEGRIDYIDARIEVDLKVENVFYHAFPKSELARVLTNRIHNDRSGRIAIDRSRVTHPVAGVSTEPDLVFLSFDAMKEKRVAFIPAKDGDPASFVEIEGSPDLICEVVSDSSEQKDTVRLAQAYFAAGVTEYWLVDARWESLDFSILKRDQEAFVPSHLDAEGYQPSTVFRHRYRFTREQGPDGHWLYTLDEQPLS